MTELQVTDEMRAAVLNARLAAQGLSQHAPAKVLGLFHESHIAEADAIITAIAPLIAAQARAEGVREGLERAAGIAEAHDANAVTASLGGAHVVAQAASLSMDHQARVIAAAIRKLKEDVK